MKSDMFNCVCVVYAYTCVSGVPLATIVEDIVAWVHFLATGTQEIGTKPSVTSRAPVRLEKTRLGPRPSE